MNKQNCAIYVRKSTEKGLEQEFNSLENQEEACKNYILSQAFNGWEYYKTYTDGGVSGGTMKRPALWEMMEEVKKGHIQVVVSYKVDRLSRSIIDFHNMMKEFEKFNCSFVSITQAFDTSTSMGKLTLNMLLSFAQFEREVSGERIRDKIAATKAKGFWVGGCPPLGYDIVDKKLVVNKNEAKQIRLIFEKYLELGSINKLREFLIDVNISSKKWTAKNGKVTGGKPFLSSSLALLLRSQVYIGRVEHKRANMSYEGRHEAVIDKKLFEKVQKLLDTNKNKDNKSHNMDGNLLSNKIFSCNGQMFKNHKTSKGGNKKYRYYALNNLYLPAGDIDAITLQTISRLFNELSNSISILDSAKRLEFSSVDFESLNPSQKKDLIKAMVEKIIFNNNQMTYFIRIDDLSYLKKFKQQNYLNTAEEASKKNAAENQPMDMNIYTDETGTNIIIEKSICFNSRHLTNKFAGDGKKVVSVSENNQSLIKALSIGWRYGRMIERGLSAKETAKIEKKTQRTVYRYLNLYYLSPNILNDIMAGATPPQANLQNLLETAGKYRDFEDQEKAFYG